MTGTSHCYLLAFLSLYGRNYPRSSIQGRTLQCRVNCNVCFYLFSTRPPKSNKIKMSHARVRYICQNAIHLISCFGCIEFGNLMLFIVWPLVPAYTGKGTESAWVYSRLCRERSSLFAVWLKNTLLHLRPKCFSIATTALSLLEVIYGFLHGGQGEETFTTTAMAGPCYRPLSPLGHCGISFRSLGLAARC